MADDLQGFPTARVMMALVLDSAMSRDDLCVLAANVPTWYRSTMHNIARASTCLVKYWCEPVTFIGDGSLCTNWTLLQRLEDEAHGFAVFDTQELLTRDAFVPVFDTLLLECPVPQIREQSRCSFSRMESAVAVHLKGWQLALCAVTK